ncbi:MAG: hypothetical protein Q9163_001032 [Psora crenata]
MFVGHQSSMRPFTGPAACLWLFSTVGIADSNFTNSLASRQILPDSFKPPQVFKNVNLMRNTNLEKGYVRETVNVVIENIDSQPQDHYFIPFKAETISKVGGLQVRDKRDPEKPAFHAEVVEYDPFSPTQFYRITLPSPLTPSAQQTLSITYYIISALTPLPAAINQQDKQYLVYSFSIYAPSVYLTENQKTKLKFPSVDIPDFTSDPERQGTSFSYGPYQKIPAGAEEEASVRYEFTKPVIHAMLLERDIEVSHWGGNLAIEERYWLTNNGANLSSQFSRLQWAMTQHYPVPTSALKELRMPLKVGSTDAYFTDDIGNVSTSRFRSGNREANLELKPRYPIFGGWKYSFRVGWNNNLSSFLRKLKIGNVYVLRAPFLEGPKMGEGVSYGKVVLRFILPEGATNVQYESPIPLVASEISSYKTFMDTLGRTTLKLTAMNLVDQSRDLDVVVTYEYPVIAAFRKPITIFVVVMAVFVTAWGIGSLDNKKSTLPLAPSLCEPSSETGTVMHFGQQLRTSLLKDYYYYYIAYDDLKSALKTPYTSNPTSSNAQPQRRPWTEDDEKSFVAQLEGELEKVYTFQRVKAEEIVRRIRASEKEVNDVIARLNQRGPRPGQQNDGVGKAGNDDDDVPTEDDFALLEEDLSDIIADVHDLAKFTQLNYTGFQKIIKKHDKQTRWILRPVFAARLKAKPFFKDNYDAFVVKLSKLYDIVRTRGNPIKGDSAAGGGQQNFVRQTTKYWVHKDNITELKLIILKNLPVLVFNPSKEFEPKDSAISSIYYDNPETWELYTGRLKKSEGAEAIRLRWYGGMETETIFVERKTHREDWTGEKSVKERFSLKEKHVNAYLSGRMRVESIFEKARKEGKKSEKEIADLEQLAREIQYRVITRELVPVTRSFYNRTAFQLPGDARVRISLDTELTMIREDNLDGRERAGKNWRRMDIGIDHPFSQLSPEDVERFPYAVLEVKLQTQAGQEPPEWVRELVGSHLVEALPKFSKFIHGTATLFPDRIHLLPFWMPQMDVDIRKPVTHNFGIERPNQSTNYSTSDEIDDDSEEDGEDDDGTEYAGAEAISRSGNNDSRRDSCRFREPQDATEQYDMARAADPIANDLDIEERISTQPLVHNPDDYPLYDSEDEDGYTDDLDRAKKSGGWYYTGKVLKHYISLASSKAASALSYIIPAPKPTLLPPSIARGGFGNVPASSITARRFKAPLGKRIHVPVRVEPKVYFAAERTFLSWLEFSIILGSIAATLLNFGDVMSMWAAIAFTIVACASLVYSMVLYLWRVRCIRERRAARYHDRWGPTVLCVGLFSAIIINFAVLFARKGELQKDREA